MGLFPLPVEDFGGLNLVGPVDQIGFSGAIDICDVDLDHPGVVRSRDKFTTQTVSTGMTTPNVIGWGVQGVIASTAAAVKTYTSGGPYTAVAPNQYFNWSVQAFGTPTTSYLYLADDALTNATRRLTTAGVISAPAGMPTCRYLSHTPNDNRLVAGRLASYPHRVQFSNAGDAETWGANDYVDLDPGDGEQITGMAVHAGLLFVFKQTKFYVFYGTTTDTSGATTVTTFNYRAVRNNVGAATVVEGEDGVYFYGLGPQGLSIFRTTGSEAVEVGRAIRPMLSGYGMPSTFTPGAFTSISDFCFAYGRVHLLGATAAGTYILSYEPTRDSWTVTQVPAGTVSITGAGAGNSLFNIAGVGANAAIHVLNPAYTGSDSLRTPTAVYQSGFDNLAPPRRFAAHYMFGNTRKRFRKWKVTGTGTVSFAVAHDFGSVGTASSLTLGTSPAIRDGWHNVATRGQLISYKLSGASWSVQKLTAYLAGSEPALLDNPSDK